LNSKVMARDPYFDVKAEVESSLQSVHTLHSSYQRIYSTLPPSHHASSEELSWALSELKATLTSLEVDVEELEETVKVVEDGGNARMLGIEEVEVRRRRGFLTRVKKDIQHMRDSVAKSSPNGGDNFNQLDRRRGNPFGIGDDSDDEGDLEAGDATAEYERQTQTLMVEQQDRTLDSISSTVGVLREQAGMMGREIYEQNEMVEDLSMHVDRTQSRLGKASKMMNHFVNENKSSGSSWCILILIIVLCVLLVAIILT